MSDSGKKLTAGSRFGLLLLITALPFAVLSLIAAPIYILNDDLQIASVLSGAYSGTPDLHTVYMRAPVSFLLSLLYRILPSVPWFGIFLCGTVFLCAFLLMRSCAGEVESFPQLLKNILPALAAILLFQLLLFWQPHYTVVAACAGATGIFLLIRAKERKDRKETFRHLLPSFLLFLLCDQIRFQVFFLLLPFVGIAVLFCFLRQEQKKEWLKTNLPLWLGWAAAWLVLFGLHSLAYAGADWQAYLKLNKARTELYDYTLVWESDAARAWYRECGVTDEAYPLYRHYDLLPDTTVTAERLAKMAEFQEPSRAVYGVQKLKNVLYDLRIHTLGMQENNDFPYAYLLIVLYLVVLVHLIREKKVLLLLPVCGCGVFHILIYGWLLWRGRTPERVTLSLYMIESFLLLAIWLCYCEKRLGGRLLAAGVLLLAFVPAAKGAGESYREHNDVNIWDNMVYYYMAERPQRLFLLETSATVNRTIPVFQRNDTERNVMLMGGWMYGSPLQSEKIRAFGYTDVQDMFSRGGVSVLYLQDLPWVLMVSDPRGRWKGLYPDDLEMYLKEQYDIGMEREAKSIYRSVGVSPDAYSEEIHCIYEYKLERN